MIFIDFIRDHCQRISCNGINAYKTGFNMKEIFCIASFSMLLLHFFFSQSGFLTKVRFHIFQPISWRVIHDLDLAEILVSVNPVSIRWLFFSFCHLLYT